MRPGSLCVKHERPTWWREEKQGRRMRERDSRISRSLLSYGEGENATAPNKIRRHSHKKKKRKKGRKHSKVKRSRSKTKNKFILQLVRTLMNNSEDHLEVDIHCKHKQLYPNNSFVRDLVTILNERNIKVINNGRVFERNRVTELVREPTTMRQTEAKVLRKLEVEQRAPDDPPPQLTGQVARVTQNQNLNRWINKKRRIKIAHAAPESAQGIDSVNNAVEQMVFSQQDANDALADKKIIIEDFVEVKPSTVTQEPFKVQKRAQSATVVKKRKRKHHHAGHDEAAPLQPEQRARATAPVVSIQQEYEEDSSARGESAQHQVSMEEMPMVSQEVASGSSKRAQAETVADSREEIDGDSEWYMSTDKPRDPPRNKTRTYRRRGSDSGSPFANEVTDDAESSAYQPLPDEVQNSTSARFRDGHGAAPLKVVMKSNLTFNLGDEFFKWRSSDDVNDILGELAIPSNTSSRAAPPLRAWVKPQPSPRQNPQNRVVKDNTANFRADTVLTGHGAHQVAWGAEGEGESKTGGNSLQAADDDSDSSSSESEEQRLCARWTGGNSLQAADDNSDSSSSESEEQQSGNAFY